MPAPRTMPPAPLAHPAGAPPPPGDTRPAALAAALGGSAEAARMAALRRVPGGPCQGLRLSRALR